MGNGVRFQRFHAGGQRAQPQHQRGAAREENTTGFGYLVQLLPLLLLLFLTFSSSLFSGPSEPTYSFTKTHNHNTEQLTNTRNVPYYVNVRDFNAYIRDDQYRLSRYERAVETEFGRMLLERCQREQRAQQQKIQRARGWFSTDEEALHRAKHATLPACDNYRQFAA
jgi:hypothetical protein